MKPSEKIQKAFEKYKERYKDSFDDTMELHVAALLGIVLSEIGPMLDEHERRITVMEKAALPDIN